MTFDCEFLFAALAVYRLASRKPKTLSEQKRAVCIAANGNLAHTAAAEIIKAIPEPSRIDETPDGLLGDEWVMRGEATRD